MSESKQDLSQRELEELSAVGAIGAAEALRLMGGGDLVTRSPRRVDGGSYRPDGFWTTGIIFEAEGIVSGLVAILFPADSQSGMGVPGAGDGHDEAVESALREMGNIVASHTVSAIANELGGSILLSIPRLVMDGADAALAALVGERNAPHCFESDLLDGEGEPAASVVFVPECPAAEAGS